MPQLKRLRPSPAMAVALTALFVALGGTAIAMSKVNGDTLIRKGTLSGNRLRNHTVSGKQVNLAKLGTVPSALSATNATNALNATNATDALTASNSLKLGGSLPSAYQGALQWALVDSDGTILAQSGGITLAGHFTGGTGAYVVFPVSLKAVMVTGAYTTADHAGRGAPIAELCGGGTGLDVCSVGPNTTSEAFVRTFDVGGTSTGTPHAFMIVGFP